MNDVTLWRVGGSSECLLSHRTVQSLRCGPGSIYTAASVTGFGDPNATNFTSVLSVTADRALDGVLVECFGPLNSVAAGNQVGSSTIQIIGMFTNACTIMLMREQSFSNISYYQF